MFMYASLCDGSDFSLGDVEVRTKTHEVEMREVRAVIEELRQKAILRQQREQRRVKVEWRRRSSDHNINAFQLLKTKVRETQKQAATERGCSKQRGRKPHWVIAMSY